MKFRKKIKWTILRVLFPKYYWSRVKIITKDMNYMMRRIFLQGSMGEDNDRREE